MLKNFKFCCSLWFISSFSFFILPSFLLHLLNQRSPGQSLFYHLDFFERRGSQVRPFERYQGLRRCEALQALQTASLVNVDLSRCFFRETPQLLLVL